MKLFLSKILGTVIILALVYGCDQSVNSEEDNEFIPNPVSIPTAANDGLESVDFSMPIATNFITAGIGTTSRQEESISVEVPDGATIEEVFLYWSRRGSESTPAPSTIMVNGIEITGNVIGGPVDMSENREMEAPITHRVNLTGQGIVGSGVSTFTIQDNPDEPAEPLGASVLVFYSLNGNESYMKLFEGVDFAFATAKASDSEQREALQNTVPRTFLFEAADVDREAELTLLIGDIEPEERMRSNSLRIEIGETNTLQIGPNPSRPFRGLQGGEWDNYIMSISIPAGTETVTVFPVSGPGDDPASLVWVLAGLSMPVP